MLSKVAFSIAKSSSRRVNNVVCPAIQSSCKSVRGLNYSRAFSSTSSDGSTDSAAETAAASPEAENHATITKLTKEVKDLKDQLMRSYAGVCLSAL